MSAAGEFGHPAAGVGRRGAAAQRFRGASTRIGRVITAAFGREAVGEKIPMTPGGFVFGVGAVFVIVIAEMIGWWGQLTDRW